MKSWLLLLSVLIYSCGSSVLPDQVKRDQSKITDTTIAGNDTIHYQRSVKLMSKNDTSLVLYSARAKDFYAVNAWHIIYSDSFQEKMQLQFSDGSLPKWYNFDNFHQPLHFDNLNGKYILRKLYLTSAYLNKISPFAMFFSGDTLFTSDTCRVKTKHPGRTRLHFEEVLYEFRTPKPVIMICDYDFIRSNEGLQVMYLPVNKSAILH